MDTHECVALLCERGRALVAVTQPEGETQDAHIRIGVDRDRALPDCDPQAWDILLTVSPDPPRPWVHVPDVEQSVAQLVHKVQRHPLSSTTLARILRIGEGLPFEDALVLESLAFSVLLTGAEFGQWKRSARPAARRAEAAGVVRFEREGGQVTITLSDPGRLNAYGARMRDELVEALESVLIDPTRPSVLLRGEGRAFCAGGDLSEFGTATDVAQAHAIRWMRSAALLLHRLGERASVSLQGPCIGAGIEIAAAASQVCSSRDAWFQLPEVGMGLLPGAGGTVTLPRRIGRHRTLYLALTGERLEAQTALGWRLVDRVVEP